MQTAAVSATPTVTASPWQRLGVFLHEELKPFPGRMRSSLIRVAGVLLAMWLGFAFNLPEMTAVVSFAFFACSADLDESKKTALGVPPVVLIILLALTLILNIFGTTPLVRTLAFAIVVFTSLFLLQAAQQGQIFLLSGIFGKVFLELWDSGYPSSLTQELELWIVADLAFAGLCAFLISGLFGKHGEDPVNRFRGALASRFEVVASFVTKPAQSDEDDLTKLSADAPSGQTQLLTFLDAASKKSAELGSHQTLFVGLIRISQLLLDQCVLIGKDSSKDRQESSEGFDWAAGRCAAIARMIRGGSLRLEPSAPPDDIYPQANRLVDTVLLAEQVASRRFLLPAGAAQKKKAFFRPDAFTNLNYLTNASRAFLAAFACYCLISGARWSGIGTAVTTCLITSLTTVEQSRQKQSLRIAGASIGAILTLVAMVYVLPAGIGLIGLSAVTALVVFIGSWVFAGGPNLNYAGVQLALCYFLGVFGENKTPTSLTSIRDRVIGIFIGNLAMWLFYDRIRPAWTVDSSRSAFADEVESIGRILEAQRPQQRLDHLAQAVLREREIFSKAQAQLKAMSDTSTPAFAPWTRAQQRDAPGIRYAESQINHLFLFEFVEAESALLRLSVVQQAEDRRLLTQSLGALASKLRGGECIEPGSRAYGQPSSGSIELLVRRVQNGLAELFGADDSTRRVGARMSS